MHSGMVFFQIVNKLVNYTNFCVVNPCSFMIDCNWCNATAQHIKHFVVMYVN